MELQSSDYAGSAPPPKNMDMNPPFSGLLFRFVKSNGIDLHIAEMGSGPLVLMLHGFPETWYSWRHQMPALAAGGYHVVAPDMRGYGKSEIPKSVEKYTTFHIVGDLVGLLDALQVKQAFVVAHDWGAYVAWNLCLFRPDRVKGLVALSVNFSPRLPGLPPVENFRCNIGEGFYICRFQEEGRAEADFARDGYENILKKILFYDKKKLLIASSDQEFSDIFEEPTKYPPWISPKEIEYYTRQFQNTGFTGGLNYYRVLDRNWELMAPWTGAKVLTPCVFVIGTQDVTYALPGAEDFIKNKMKMFVPNLKAIIEVQGAHHFVHEERPNEVNAHILKFLGQFIRAEL